jgi:hypothetical protein
MMYTDLLTLVIDVAVRFYRTVHGSDESSSSLNMYDVFGDTIATFRERREAITRAIWKDQIDADDSIEEDADVSSISRWLEPQDRVLATLALDHTLIADELAEFTCVWFLDDLAKFIKSENASFLVNGDAGAGKTTLAASLAERFQRPIGRKAYTTAFCSVGAVPSQATSLNVVKALMHSILNIRVGNMHLYHAVVQAYETARYEPDPTKYEDLLWQAFELALRSPLENAPHLVLIVEGLDELIGGQSAGQALLQRLVRAVEQGKGVKLVALAQNLKLPTGARGVQQSITVEDTRSDMHQVILKTLVKSAHFRGTTGREQETNVKRIIDIADGSFLWASLTAEVLRMEKSGEDYNKAIGNLEKPKASIEDLVQTLLSRLQPTDDAKLLLSWLVNAARPLTYHEIEALYTLNVQQGTRVDRGVDVHSIVQTLAPLIDVQEDIVRPRHNLVHNAIRSLLKQGKVTMPIKDQAFDLLLRLLTYAKLSLPDKGEPTLDASDRSIIDHHFNRHIFLEYVIRYWTWHLQQASVCTLSKPDEIKMTPELQKVFPDSTIMPILEWLCWDDQFPGAQEVEYHDLVGHLRAKVLTEKHPAVLQSSINTACYYEMMEDWPTASARYYSISTIGRTILSVSHPIVVETASRFLRISETRVTKTRTEVVTQREQVLLLLIAAYERQYGPNHDIVVRTREQLADLYIHIGENDKATEVLQIIHGHVQDNYRNGETSTRANDEHLRIKFGKSRDRGDLKEYENGIFTGEDEEEESLVIREIEQVDVILRQIEQYISQKDYVRAEQTYIELWQRLSETCRTTLSVDWHQKKIQVVQSYAKFLETNKRRTEATSIITATWKEYENHELSFSEKIVSSLTECARFLKNVGEYTAALSIFKHASYYYRNIKKEESKSLMEIEEEMIQTTTQAFSRTTKDETTKTSTSESTHYEMFHVLISNKSKAIDQSTMTLAHTLTNKYIEQRSWAEAISVVQETLARTWSSFLSKSVHEVTMTETFRQESIELVEKLAIIYREQRIWEKVEDVYVRLFRAALTNPKDQALLEKARTHLVDFYTKRGRPGKVIQIYQELLAVYRRTLGPSHDTTVTILYQLGSLCRLHARSHPYWIEYYQQICNSLNNDSATIHTRAFDAAVIVAESYWEECRYSDAVVAYAIIWNTFVQKNKEFKTFTDVAFVQNLYERYYQSLEESKSDFDVLKIVTSQYRDTTKTIFGANSLIYVEATVALARVTQRSDSHQDDSIALFEEAFQSSRKDAALSKSLQIDQGEFRQTLTTMYKKRIFHSSNAASPETMAKAISIYETQVSEKKSKYGYSHEETLTSLRELAQLYVRQQKTDLAVKELQNAVVEIVQKETSSQRAYESAIAIVQTYQAANLTQQLVQLTEELHYQLIVREKRQSSTFSVVESSSVSLFFLATIQYQIRKDLSLTLSDTMASLTSEYIMYQNFKQLVKNKAALDKLLLAAAPLRQHLRFWNRTALVGAVDHECVQIFVQREASSVQLLSKDSPRHFIIGIMDYIGNRKHVEFVRAVIIASNGTLKKLIDNNQFQDAHDIAKMTFMYAQHRNGYRGPKGISRGFELASYLDGRGENKCPDPELRKKMLQLSNKIVKDIIVICREQQINFAQVPLKELNELIALLGEQGDYDTLEVRPIPAHSSDLPLTLRDTTGSPQRALEHARSPEELARQGPPQPRPSPHLRPLPRRSPNQSAPPLRGHRVQPPPRQRQPPPRHAGGIRHARGAVHQPGPSVPETDRRQSRPGHGGGPLQESGRGARRSPPLAPCRRYRRRRHGRRGRRRRHGREHPRRTRHPIHHPRAIRRRRRRARGVQ